MQSGLPLNPTIANRSLSNNPAAAGTANDRPNLDPSFNRATVITHNPSNWFNETMFDLPVAGTQFGSSPTLTPNSTAGQITFTVTTSRQIQLSLKLIF
jgi:hypothetical protein